MKIISQLLALTLIFLVSCSQNTINWLTAEKTPSANLNNLNSEIKNINICEDNNLKILVSTEEARNNFDKLLNNTAFYYLTNIEKALSLALIELVRRPDLNSPQANFQFYFGNAKGIQYYHFSNKNTDGLPVIFGIDFLLKKFSKNKNILNLAIELDKILPENLYVDRGLENFIIKNKIEISKSTVLASTFLRGDEPLSRFESFKRANITNLVKYYLKNSQLILEKNYQIKLNQLDYHQNFGNAETSCNFNLVSDQDPINIDLANNDNINYIGLTNKDEAFMASFFSLRNPQINLINDQLFFKSTPSPIELPVCIISNPSLDLKMIISSTEGRSKNQHLKHLMDYEIYNSATINQLNDILNFPRHLFLSNPDRILYESKKGRESQLNFFLSMNFPIYHVEKLGNITGLIKFKNNPIFNFVKDIRNNDKAICTK